MSKPNLIRHSIRRSFAPRYLRRLSDAVVGLSTHFLTAPADFKRLGNGDLGRPSGTAVQFPAQSSKAMVPVDPFMVIRIEAEDETPTTRLIMADGQQIVVLGLCADVWKQISDATGFR